MKFPRDKQQKKKVAKVGQDEGKTRRRGEESREERRRPAVSAFISIHILFVVFILSNPWELEPAAWDNQHNEWSALERVLSMDCAFVYKARMYYNDDDEDEARTSCASVRLGRVVSETNAFHFKCSCCLVTPGGPCFLSFSVAGSSSRNNNKSNNSNN